MTKVEAIKKVLQVNGGQADLQTIYRQIGRYYKGAKASAEWSAGIRGVLYREIRNKRTFYKIDAATYGLKDVEGSLCAYCPINDRKPAVVINDYDRHVCETCG